MTRASEFEMSVRQAQAEESVQKLEGELAAGRQRVLLLEAAGKARDKEVERLQKQVRRGGELWRGLRGRVLVGQHLSRVQGTGGSRFDYLISAAFGSAQVRVQGEVGC